MLAIGFAGAGGFAGPSAKTTLSWVSHPLRPGETAIVSGGALSNASNVTLTTASGKQCNLKAFDSSSDGAALKFTMPAATSIEAYDLSIDGASLPINLPEAWWWQGDAGHTSTPGGWVRVFGRSIGLPDPEVDSSTAEDARSALNNAVSRGDFRAAESLLREMQAHADHMQRPATTKAVTKLRLTPVAAAGRAVVTASPIELTALGTNASEYDALFLLPATLALGDFMMEISNGLATGAYPDGWMPVSMFLTPDAPAAATLTVAAPRPWKTDVFAVDCDWARPIFERPCGWVGARSSKQLDAALAAAAANGGGIVHLPRGQYYIDGPIMVPDGVVLRGEAEQLVSIYFRETNPDVSPRPGLIFANESATAWAVTDLTVYVTHHYWSVFYVSARCRDWSLERVRVRAAAWAFLSDPQVTSGRGNRLANFTREDVGEVVYLGGNDNYRIVDCDLLGTGIIIHTGAPRVDGGGTASNGYIARNTLWNSNAAHWFSGIKQVIFEWNTVRPGGVELSWGNNVDNYEQGYAQHVWHAHNSFQHVYAGDRELMTFDPVYGDYNGPATVAADGVTLSVSALGNGSISDVNALGGMVSVLAGTGSGQSRRSVGRVGTTSLRLDAPFETPLDASSVVQLGPYKGRMLFHRNRYQDGGAFQLCAPLRASLPACPSDPRRASDEACEPPRRRQRRRRHRLATPVRADGGAALVGPRRRTHRLLSKPARAARRQRRRGGKSRVELERDGKCRSHPLWTLAPCDS